MNYFERFFGEKNLPLKQYEVDHNGTTHLIDSDFIIELLKETKGDVANQIQRTLIQIDFANGDVHHFLEHLANGYVKENC
jgi:hypothetical protein